MTKEKGILLPIFSLPSNYGIGDFGPNAYEFIDILSENKIDYWNILPIYDTNDNSFYSPNSFYALFTLYISLDDLYEKGLIGKPKKYKKEKRINYEKVYQYKNKYFKEAFSNFKEDDNFKSFIENKNIRDYAEFKFYIQKYKNIDDIVLEENIDIKYYLFLQYILHEEWYKLKEYANKKNVKILGDMPIYPDYNSVEVFKNKNMYQLKNGLKHVSGASPDYFNSKGQKWGHPLYDFEYMKKDSYRYLINRYLDANKKFDVVRIDHFRAFDTYFKIPIDKDASYGGYEEGPSNMFFDELFKYTSNDKFIVEDLGSEIEKTIELRDHYHLMGMKVLQYVFDGYECVDSKEGNTLVYTGNHDNDTIVGWYKKSKNKKEIKKLLKNNNCYERKIHFSFIKYALKCNGKLVIIPVQDLLGLGTNSRINIPGTCGNFNWSWKLKNFKGIDKNIKRVFK